MDQQQRNDYSKAIDEYDWLTKQIQLLIQTLNQQAGGLLLNVVHPLSEGHMATVGDVTLTLEQTKEIQSYIREYLLKTLKEYETAREEL